jgi:hypothetical protein
MSTYEALMLYLKNNRTFTNVRQMSKSGEFSCCQRQMLRIIKKAKRRGEIVVYRLPDEQGNPLVVELAQK